MSHWNYRLVKYKDEREGYGIHEVYYDDKGDIDAWEDMPADLVGDSPEEMVTALGLMLASIQKRKILHEEDLP